MSNADRRKAPGSSDTVPGYQTQAKRSKTSKHHSSIENFIDREDKGKRNVVGLQIVGVSLLR